VLQEYRKGENRDPCHWGVLPLPVRYKENIATPGIKAQTLRYQFRQQKYFTRGKVQARPRLSLRQGCQKKEVRGGER
jgi:hypothetical protein